MAIVERRDAGFLAYWALNLALRALPAGLRLRTAVAVANVCARLWLWLAPAERKRTLSNLRLILGPESASRNLEQINLAHHESHVLAFLLPDLLPSLTQAQLREMSEVRGLEHLEAARAQGRGAVLLCAHIATHGYLVVAALAAHGVPVTAIAGEEGTPVGADEPDRSWIYRRLVHPMRSRPRASLPFLTKGLILDPRAVRVLQRNEALWVQGDMHMSDEEAAREHFAIPVPFLWGTAMLRTGPVRLAKVFKAPILPCMGYREGMRLILEIQAPLALTVGNTQEDYQADLRAYLDRLEPCIRARPDQWAFTRHEILPRWIHSAPSTQPAQPAERLPARVA
jgi:lauroyl/myristoyl acyltransferase